MPFKKILLHISFVIITINGYSQLKTNKVIDANAIEFQNLIDSCSNEIIIDVQTISEFKANALSGAINAPTKNDLFNITDTLDRDTPVLIYCNEGVRSLQASQLLLKNNFNLVVNLKNGLDDWVEQGFEVSRIE